MKPNRNKRWGGEIRKLKLETFPLTWITTADSVGCAVTHGVCKILAKLRFWSHHDIRIGAFVVERVEESWALLVAAWKVQGGKFEGEKFEGWNARNLLHEPDSIKTGTNGRVAADVCGCKGWIFMGVDRAAREAPISTDSTSMWANELLKSDEDLCQLSVGKFPASTYPLGVL